MQSKWNAGIKVFEFLTPKIKKNLTERRKTFETMTEAVDKQYTTTGVRPGQSGSKIKRDAVLEGSKIHDKYERFEKILKKRK